MKKKLISVRNAIEQHNDKKNCYDGSSVSINDEVQCINDYCWHGFEYVDWFVDIVADNEDINDVDKLIELTIEKELEYKLSKCLERDAFIKENLERCNDLISQCNSLEEIAKILMKEDIVEDIQYSINDALISNALYYYYEKYNDYIDAEKLQKIESITYDKYKTISDIEKFIDDVERNM